MKEEIMFKNNYYEMCKNEERLYVNIINPNVYLPDIHVEESETNIKFYTKEKIEILKDFENSGKLTAENAQKIIEGYKIAQKTIDYFERRIINFPKATKYYVKDTEDFCSSIVKENYYYDGECTKESVICNLEKEKALDICKILNSLNNLITFNAFEEEY